MNDEPIELMEPGERIEEKDERQSLVEAFDAEIELLKGLGRDGGKHQAYVATQLAASLERIRERWVKDISYELDMEERKIVKIVP